MPRADSATPTVPSVRPGAPVAASPVPAIGPGAPGTWGNWHCGSPSEMGGSRGDYVPIQIKTRNEAREPGNEVRMPGNEVRMPGNEARTSGNEARVPGNEPRMHRLHTHLKFWYDGPSLPAMLDGWILEEESGRLNQCMLSWSFSGFTKMSSRGLRDSAQNVILT